MFVQDSKCFCTGYYNKYLVELHGLLQDIKNQKRSCEHKFCLILSPFWLFCIFRCSLLIEMKISLEFFQC